MADFDKIIPVLHAILMHGGAYSNMGSDYSVTDLIQPPRIVQLKKRYSAYLPDPVPSEQIKSFIGTAVHNYFEFCLRKYMGQHPEDKYLIERRLWDKIHGRKISGKFDCWYDEVLFDFKCTTVWKAIFGDHIDWEKQLNLYNYFLYLEGVKVRKQRIIALYLDWQKFESMKNKQYPKEIIQLIDIPIWSRKDQKDFLYNKVADLIKCEESPDYDLPKCTYEDRWEKETKWAAYYQNTEGKAKRVLDTKEGIEEWITWKCESGEYVPEDYIIVKRPGYRMRCEEYCRYNGWCNQYQNYVAEKESNGENN